MQRIHVALLALVGLGLASQLVPYGRRHDAEPVRAEPDWDRRRTRALFFRACKDCHSNETDWPWYGLVAPASWLVQHDVDEGRSHFNVSEWGREHQHGDEAADRVREGEMPPWSYRLAHTEARLSEAERRELVAGLVATFGEDEPDSSHHHDHDHGP